MLRCALGIIVNISYSNQELYLIEILHQTTTAYREKSKVNGCILLKFYIKPQRTCALVVWRFCCILLKFYIKPQPPACNTGAATCCILLKFYIKPQRQQNPIYLRRVVSY